MAIWTLGHSTRSIEDFIALLKAHGIQQLIDVRTAPGSRKYPHFNSAALAASLRAADIAYQHMPGLGGFRKPKGDSPNGAWQNANFRGYADYMLTPEFAAEVGQLLAAARTRRTAIMCSEAVPWRCHRSLIADALTARGIEVRHIMSPTTANPHRLTSFARVEGQRVTYPALGAQIST